MTREIKFRAWDKRDSKMHEVFGLTNISVCYKENAKMPAYEVLSDEIQIMQYTGLLDKNGKEIYEGDIVQLFIGKHTHEKPIEVKWKQEIGSCGCCFEEFFGNGFVITGGNCCEYEIIGNIYENPELLK